MFHNYRPNRDMGFVSFVFPEEDVLIGGTLLPNRWGLLYASETARVRPKLFRPLSVAKWSVHGNVKANKKTNFYH